VPNLVDLAPGDASGGALPAPFGGARALWFGSDASGNFAGTLANESQDGGTSAEPRSGVASSPEFYVPSSGSVALVFRSWFEIESVNPSHYDVMDVTVREVGTELSATKRLNPETDPAETDPPVSRARTPLTADGLNAPPSWTLETLDLSALKGKRVVVTFSFDTGDQNYNGFRGWIVDDVAIQVAAGVTATHLAVPLRATNAVVPTTRPPARTWHP
jgi:hypothetical protein